MLRASMAYIHPALEISTLKRQILELFDHPSYQKICEGRFRGLRWRNFLSIISEPVKNSYGRFKVRVPEPNEFNIKL